MGLSLSELIRRARLKIESLSKEELRLNEAVVVAQGKIAVCKSEKRQKYAELGTLISRLEKRKADGLKLSRMPMDEMSSDRGARFRQALNLVHRFRESTHIIQARQVSISTCERPVVD